MISIDWQAQRQTAIHLLRSGRTPTEVAQQLHRPVSWVCKWRDQFEQAGWAGLASRSRAPKQHGRAHSSSVRQAICQARSELEAEAATKQGLRYIGSAAVQAKLSQKVEPVMPSTATIERVLRAAGLVRSSTTRSAAAVAYPHLQPRQPLQLVQVDIVPHFLRGGQAVACFNAIDVVSRYPTGRPTAQRRSQDAAAFLIHTWQEIGLPQYTQVDNEGCFSGGFTHPGVLGKVVRLALWVGPELVFSPFYHPESNSTVERFHQDYDYHVWDETDLTDIPAVEASSDRFFALYRHSRHHSALKGRSPAQVHQPVLPRQLSAAFTLPDQKLPLTEGRVHFIRRVSPAGTVEVLNLAWTVPNPDLTKGVWVTLEFKVSGATLRIYDAAPDTQQRRCLAVYPFPLKEVVQPQPVSVTEQIPQHKLLVSRSETTQSGAPSDMMVKVLLHTIYYVVKAARHFLFTMY